MRRLFFCLGSLFMLTAMCAPPVAQQKKEKPNVLVILVDDLGYSDLGFMGSSYYETPNIDQLAASGTMFTHAYSNSAVCSPSRASIMLGQFTARHGITDWIGAASGTQWRKLGRHDRLLPATYREELPRSSLTIAQALKQYGYATFFAGKWHLGGEGAMPEDYGFDINIGGNHTGRPVGGYFSPYKNPQLADRPHGESLTLRLAGETASFIRNQRGDRPFFAYLSFYAVHGPLQTTRKRWEKYRKKAATQGVAERGFAMGNVLPLRLQQDNPVYAGMIETMDDAVGVVIEALKEQGILDNTIIVFTSDNGGVVSGDSYSTNLAPLKGGKGQQWEGGIRVPMIIRHPKLPRVVNEVNVPVAGSDIFPTVLDLVGYDLMPGAHADGISLKPLMKGDTITERPLIWHYPHYGNQGGRPCSIIRKGQWKLIHYYDDNTDALYDVVSDVGETKDQHDIQPEIAAALRDELNMFLSHVGAAYPQPDETFDPAAREEWEAGIRSKLLPKLEDQRKKMLSEDYQPSKDWWGSEMFQ